MFQSPGVQSQGEASTLYLLPHLGHIKRRDLKVRHLDKMYDAIEKENSARILHRLRADQLQKDRDDAHQTWVRTAGYAKREERRSTRRAFLEANTALREGKQGLRKVSSAATMHRINDTLSSALSWGIKREARRFTRLVELSGLPPVRLHDLRHLAATLSLLAGTDIKVVQEKLGHSSRQITSDTYTSVLPEMMRAEAESVMAVVPRDVPFQVRTPLMIPETAWQGDIAVFFVHGARQPGDTWAVGAQTQPESDLLGMITLAGRGQDDAANAAVKWIRDHCTANDLELVRVENFNDRYPEEQRADFALTRFTIARSESPGLDGWALPTGLPPAAARTARRTSKGRRKAA